MIEQIARALAEQVVATCMPLVAYDAHGRRLYGAVKVYAAAVRVALGHNTW